MKHCAILASLFLWTGIGQTQDAITIKIKTEGEGDVILVAKNDTVKGKFKIEDNKGKVLLDQTTNTEEIAEFKATIVKREGTKRATKLEREYTKFQLKDGDDTRDLLERGKHIIVERDGDKYTLTYKGGEAVGGLPAATLMKEFGRKRESSDVLEKLMLPKIAVKVGDTWKLDMEAVLRELAPPDAEVEYHNAKATGTGKLVKTYKKGERLFGEIRYQVTMPLKSMGKAPMRLDFDEAAKTTMDLSMDVCIDGTSIAGTAKTRIVISGTAKAPGRTIHIESNRASQLTQAEPTNK